MKTLKERYELIIDEYIIIFEKKHDVDLEFWVSDDKTGVASFGCIYFFSVADIIYDIDNNLPEWFIFEWLDDCVEYYEMKGQTINLHSYHNGLRFHDLPDVEERIVQLEVENKLIEGPINILKKHNKWRRNGEGEMVDPSLLGIAIDAVVEWVESELKNKSEKSF